ncbi:DHH family phosphoesterase [Fodinisporobacter ferrooxydans]|uniref:DHH family phosphoesterase n=1 Tax=Fodinisporobacter ferrooxydans TaxID=2901836 RepID=A0ABY4CV92_9BACL|nr:DHH family phosphoesterase [Alicyclobacillaceae bacterium MYW30-H2]
MDLFLQRLVTIQGANALILCHDHADSDAVGAAYALAKYLDGTIGVPKRVAAHAKGLLDTLRTTIVIQPDLSNFQHVIVVDTANAAQLTDCMPAKFLLIDHHPTNTLLHAAESALYDGTASSTSQLVYRMFKKAGIPIDRDVALALCAGIMTDTINFHKGDAEAFQTFGELLEAAKLTYEDVQSLYVVDERKDRKAIIQAALQARHVEIEGYEILVTQIHTNIPTFAARALFDLGADVSVVGYTNQSDIEIRMYLRHDLIEQCGLHAADILKRVKDIDTKLVWGYSLFAGYRSQGNLDGILQSVLDTFQEVLAERS